MQNLVLSSLPSLPDALLSLLYIIAAPFLLRKLPFFKKSGLSALQIHLLYALVCLAALGNFYIYNALYGYGDCIMYMDRAKHIWELRSGGLPVMVHDFFNFTEDGSYARIFDFMNPKAWETYGLVLLARIIFLCYLLAFTQTYATITLFSILTFSGLVALRRTLVHYFPNKQLTATILCFGIPSTLFWCSGLYKDSITLIFSSWLVFFTCRWLAGTRRIPNLIGAVIMLLLINFTRSYVFLGIFPAWGLWILSAQRPQHSGFVFLGTYTAFIILAFSLPMVSSINFPQLIVNRQHEFLTLQGHSFMPLNPLYPNFRSFLNNAPQAINHALLRPYPGEAYHILMLLSGIESLCITILIITCLFYIQKDRLNNPFLLFCLFYAGALLILLGYTVPFSGAFVRYRSAYLPFLLAPVLLTIDHITIPVIRKRIYFR